MNDLLQWYLIISFIIFTLGMFLMWLMSFDKRIRKIKRQYNMDITFAEKLEAKLRILIISFIPIINIILFLYILLFRETIILTSIEEIKKDCTKKY